MGDPDTFTTRQVTFVEPTKDGNGGYGTPVGGESRGTASCTTGESVPIRTPAVGPISMVSTSPSLPEADGADRSTPQTTSGFPDRGSSHDSGAVEGSDTNSDTGLMQQLTQLVQTQTAMVMAQTRAMSAQNLPPYTPL